MFSLVGVVNVGTVSRQLIAIDTNQGRPFFLNPQLYQIHGTEKNDDTVMDAPKPFREKTLYRTSQKFDEDDISSQCGSSVSARAMNARPKLSRSRASAHQLNAMGRANTAGAGRGANKLNRSQDNIDWHHLGEKIEDWFGYAKTPDQKVVYKFLNNLHRDDDQDSQVSEYRPDSQCPSVATHVKTQSLEDILDNLKKYRQKFHRQEGSKSAKPHGMHPRSALPKVHDKKDQANLEQRFESSTWRVMRHLKSADIRSKYPLPKANPDYHFRNATIFHVAGRAPKSTFLLHPDWV